VCPPIPGISAAPYGTVPVGHRCCDAAITAMVSEVGVTANVAVTALTALTALARRRGHTLGAVPPSAAPPRTGPPGATT
jgi:hypothetical protein